MQEEDVHSPEVEEDMDSIVAGAAVGDCNTKVVEEGAVEQLAVAAASHTAADVAVVADGF
mgnify:CR=1 FL=1